MLYKNKNEKMYISTVHIYVGHTHARTRWGTGTHVCVHTQGGIGDWFPVPQGVSAISDHRRSVTKKKGKLKMTLKI